MNFKLIGKIFTWISGTFLISFLIGLVLELMWGFPFTLIPVLGPWMIFYITAWINFIALCVLVLVKLIRF